MRIVTFATRVLALVALAMFVSGCSKPASNNQGAAGGAGSSPTAEHGHDYEDGHDHEEEHEGPHDGHVIELGRNHMYHAELVENDEAGALTVYILNKDMRELAINQASITMNLKVDGQAKSFELTAAAGSTSQFNAADKTLFEALHEHEATGKLRVTIDGSPYTGEVEHHHHGDDDHEHKH